jgi:hypothetical protein
MTTGQTTGSRAPARQPPGLLPQPVPALGSDRCQFGWRQTAGEDAAGRRNAGAAIWGRGHLKQGGQPAPPPVTGSSGCPRAAVPRPPGAEQSRLNACQKPATSEQRAPRPASCRRTLTSLSVIGGRSCPPAKAAPRPALPIVADARFGTREQPSDVGVVANEHQHRNSQCQPRNVTICEGCGKNRSRRE